MQTLKDRGAMVGRFGAARWHYRGKYPDGLESACVAESESLDSFTSFELDTSHALWNRNPPRIKQTSSPFLVVHRKRAPLSKHEALIRLSIHRLVIRRCMVNNQNTNRVCQVYDFCPLVWRLLFNDSDWKELAILEVKTGEPNARGLRNKRS